MLDVVNKLLNTKNVLPLRLKQTFPPIIWIFTEGEGDEIESRLPFKIFSTLRWRNLLDFLSHLTVVFPMFNQCIRFGEGGVRPTHSIQAIARTKRLSWVSLQWNGTDPSFLRQPENVNQSSTWWDDGTYFSNSREMSIC